MEKIGFREKCKPQHLEGRPREIRTKKSEQRIRTDVRPDAINRSRSRRCGGSVEVGRRLRFVGRCSMSKVQLANCGYTMRRVAGSGELGSSSMSNEFSESSGTSRVPRGPLRLHVTELSVGALGGSGSELGIFHPTSISRPTLPKLNAPLVLGRSDPNSANRRRWQQRFFSPSQNFRRQTTSFPCGFDALQLPNNPEARQFLKFSHLVPQDQEPQLWTDTA